MENLSKSFDELKKSMKIQAVSVFVIVILSILSNFITYKLGYINRQKEVVSTARALIKQPKSSYTIDDIAKITLEVSEVPQTDYEIKLLQFDNIQVKSKDGHIYKIKLDELEDLIINSEI
jgi:hypothetical protein